MDVTSVYDWYYAMGGTSRAQIRTALFDYIMYERLQSCDVWFWCRMCRKMHYSYKYRLGYCNCCDKYHCWPKCD